MLGFPLPRILSARHDGDELSLFKSLFNVWVMGSESLERKEKNIELALKIKRKTRSPVRRKKKVKGMDSDGG